MEPEDEDEESDDEESEPLMDISVMSEVSRKVYCWEEAMYTTEAAELIERLERREMIIQEIRMNAYLNGTTCTLRWYKLTVWAEQKDGYNYRGWNLNVKGILSWPDHCVVLKYTKCSCASFTLYASLNNK